MKFSKFSPDLIVLFFYPPNDIADVSKDLSPEKLRPFFLYDDDRIRVILRYRLSTGYSGFRLKKLINPFKRNSALISLVTERYQMLLERQREGSVEGECNVAGYLSLATSRPGPLYSQAFELNKLLIKETARVVKKQADMLLVTIDSLGWKLSDKQCVQSKDATFNAFYFEDELRRLASGEKIHYLGLQREFRRDWEKNQRQLHWGHWNYEGHKLVATLLADKVATILESRHRYYSKETIQG